MKKTLASLVIAAALVGVGGTPAYAQENAAPDRTGEIDRVFAWATPATPGAVVAVSRNGKVVASRAYGLADLERGVPMRTDSVFDIGSLRKQFIAAAVLLLVEDGRLSLSEDVRTYIPELPEYGHRITLDHLLTHTSGVRDWTGLGPLTGRGVDALTVTLRQRGLNFAPGEEWSYSNSGYVLLKEVVARTAGMPFDAFARTRLFEPLGMTATVYREDLRDVVKNRALAYEKEGDGWQMDVLFGNERGGGGALLSTAGDLVLWNEALANARLGRFVSEKLQEPARLNNGRKLRYARGLIVEPFRGGGTVVWHSGGAAGYHGWLGRLPEQGLSIAVLCNSDAVPATALARRVADQFLPAPSAAAEAGDAAPPAAAADLSGKAGLFFSEETGEPLRLSADGGRLRVVGGPALDALGGDRFRNPRGDLFFRSQDRFELHFVSPDRIEMKSLEGKTTRYRRARPDALPADALKAFAGRYANDETRAVFDIGPGGGGGDLTVRLNDSPPAAFRSVDHDTFQLGGMILRFRRDGAGKVAGLDYSNPVVRDVRFARLPESRKAE